MKVSFGIIFGVIFLLTISMATASLHSETPQKTNFAAIAEPILILPPPLPPDTSLPKIDTTQEESPSPQTREVNSKTHTEIQHEETSLPVRLLIPSIHLNAPIEYMGQNDKGEMDVPEGNTKNVGWYKDGTIPGAIGSAVLDAHVFAAFAKLHQLKPGDDIYVTTERNTKLHFVVVKTRVYPLAQVPTDLLFKRDDARRLNLITCAGTFIRSKATYDHRLIVYTKLVE